MKSWRERIAEARARGYFTADDNRLALRWTTCAVGERRRAHGPRVVVFYRGGDVAWNAATCGVFGPADDRLWNDGADFGLAVRANNPDVAERMLDAIEDRALQLKREHIG